MKGAKIGRKVLASGKEKREITWSYRFVCRKIPIKKVYQKYHTSRYCNSKKSERAMNNYHLDYVRTFSIGFSAIRCALESSSNFSIHPANPSTPLKSQQPRWNPARTGNWNTPKIMGRKAMRIYSVNNNDDIDDTNSKLCSTEKNKNNFILCQTQCFLSCTRLFLALERRTL